jgi:hypothetical protein
MSEPIVVEQGTFCDKVTDYLSTIEITIPEGMKGGEKLKLDDLVALNDPDHEMVVEMEMRLSDLLNDCGGENYHVEKID